MTKKYNPKEKVFYYIFEKKGILTSYRDLAVILDLPVSTLHRVVKELVEERKIKTSPEGNYTHFEAIGVEKETTIFDFPINTDPAKFTTRQHKLVDYLMEQFKRNPDRYVPKMEVLFWLQHLYFIEDSRDTINLQFRFDNNLDVKARGCTANLQYYLEEVGKRRYSMKEYGDLTSEVQFNNAHCDIRQVLIISRAGKNGGIKIAKKSEAADYLRREQIHILKKFERYHIKRKFLEKDGNFRFVFEEDSKAKKYIEITK